MRKREGDKLKVKLITMACIVFILGLGVNTLATDLDRAPGVYLPGENAAWGEDSRASIWLAFAGYNIKVNTLGGGAFEGSFIDQDGCAGGDIRGMFTAPGEFAMVFYNWERYDYRCGFVIKGDLNLPPPLYGTFMNEVGLGSGGATLSLTGSGVWFHESVNDGAVQDWVAGPGWGVNSSWKPTSTYDMVGTGASDWSLTYYGARTYPRPAHDGFQYEACFRKNSGNPNNTMALYFNGDGTMDNCIIIVMDTLGNYAAFEVISNLAYSRISWVFDEPNLFRDDTALGGENDFNMVKVNVSDSGAFDVFLNENYVGSAQATNHFSGYVGLAVFDSVDVDHVSCDNMTLSTIPMLKENIAGWKVHDPGQIAVDEAFVISSK